MHIFIDESGTFAIPADGAESPSVLGALIVPDHKIDLLFKRYGKLRQNLPKEGGEVKGRRLNEANVAAAIDLMRRNNCIFEAIVVEMSLETPEGIERHRAGAAEGLTANLTDDHKKALVEGVWELRKRLEAMPLPLYLQSTLMNHLLGNIIREIPVYWAQRQPKEILNFHWVVDSKGIDKLTNAEEWWSATKLGFMQSQLAREPMLALEGLDYSEFDRKFRGPMPEYLRETLFPDREDGYDLRLLLDESFRFSSAADYGIELVDIVTNATRRALKGNLAKEGWETLPSLMINRRDPCLQFRTLSGTDTSARLPYRQVALGPFKNGGRSMLTKSTAK